MATFTVSVINGHGERCELILALVFLSHLKAQEWWNNEFFCERTTNSITNFKTLDMQSNLTRKLVIKLSPYMSRFIISNVYRGQEFVGECLKSARCCLLGVNQELHTHSETKRRQYTTFRTFWRNIVEILYFYLSKVTLFCHWTMCITNTAMRLCQYNWRHLVYTMASMIWSLALSFLLNLVKLRLTLRRRESEFITNRSSIYLAFGNLFLYNLYYNSP